MEEFTKEDEKAIEENIANIIYIADGKRGEKSDVKHMTYYPNTTWNRILRTLNTYVFRRDGSETKEGYLDFVRKTCDQTFEHLHRYSNIKSHICVTLLTTLYNNLQKVPKGIALHMEEYRDQRGDHIYKVEAFLETLKAKMVSLTPPSLNTAPITIKIKHTSPPSSTGTSVDSGGDFHPEQDEY